MPVGSTTVTCRLRPTWLWRITPISGPGQAIPRASITWSVATSVTAIPPHSDEDQLAVGGEHEGRDALDVVHQRVQVAPVQAEQVHRQRARMHAHLAELLGLVEHRAPVLPATGGQQPPHRGGTVGSRLRRKPVVLDAF